MHRLPGDLGDPREVRGRELAPGLEHAEDPVLLRRQSEVADAPVERRDEALMREPEQVSEVRLRPGVGLRLGGA